MYAPQPHDELDGIIAYVEQQLDAVRASIIGLTESQARSTPCRSALSIDGLVKHAVYCMQGTIDRIESGPSAPGSLDEAAWASYSGSFSLSDDESGAGMLERFDALRPAYLAALRSVDPSAPSVEDPAPWFGIFDNRPARGRYNLVHQIEELARHAGHADIIREEIDGVSVPAIVLSLEGMPAGEFFQPYVPAPGTIGAG